MTKRNAFLTFTFFSLALLSSCTREIEPAGGKTVFNASFEDTKTILTDTGSVIWENGDEVSVNGVVFKATVDKDPKYAKLVYDGEASLTAPFTAYYPSSVYDGAKAVFPSVQKYVEGTIRNVPMYACSNTNSLAFKNICGVLAVKVKSSDMASVKSVTLSSADHAFSGSFTVVDNTAVLDNPDSTGATTTLVCDTAVPTSAEGTVFHIAVPAQSYHRLKIAVSDGTTTKYMTSQKSTDLTILRNRVYNVGFDATHDEGLVPTSGYNRKSAHWEITTSSAASASTAWTSDNRFYASAGDGAGSVYASTSGASPVRSVYSDHISVSNLTTGDAIVFTWPSVLVAGGSTIDFSCILYASSGNVPKYWLFEYFEDGEWKSVAEDLRTAAENSSLKYSFYLYKANSQYATFTQTFSLKKGLDNADLKMRLRAVGTYNASGSTLSANSSAYVSFANQCWRGASIDIYQDCTIKDVKKILQLGNSFSQYYATAFLLKSIARSQGHEIRLRAFNKGSQYFRNHLTLEKSIAEVKDGGFDYAILQDQSGQHSRYGSDPVTNASVLTETQELIDYIATWSPSATFIVENTWAYKGSANWNGYGSFEAFDIDLQTGARSICDQTSSTMSPIGIAFQKAREDGITDLYHSDSKHPNRNGAYLKSCVNYLLIYGERFNDKVPDLLVKSTVAAKLRKVAEDVVIDGWTPSFFVLGTPTKTSFETEGGQGSVQVKANVEYNVSCTAPWVSLSNVSGTVTWTVSASAEDDGRNADIVFTPTGMTSRTISISQAGNVVKGGISTPEDLLDFAALVNAGSNFDKYKNEKGEVALNNDIDMKGKTWTPIGVTEAFSMDYYTLTEPGAGAFDGVFNGNGHAIKNLSMSVDIQKTQRWGLFGCLKGATVKNFTLTGASLTISGSGISSKHASVALVAAYMYGGTVSNVTVNGSISGSPASTANRNVAIGGICGFIGNGAIIESCTMSGTINVSVDEKYSNNNTASVAGICAAVVDKSPSKRNSIKGCVNTATITAKAHRAAGIVATLFYTNVENCTNSGAITCDYSANAISKGTTISGVRMGGVMGYCCHQSMNASIVNCHNTGTIKTSQPGSATGGVAGLIRCMDVRSCSSACTVIGPDSVGRGILVGAITSATTESSFFSCKLKGKTGTSESSLVDCTAENFLDKGIGITISSGVSCSDWNQDEISFWQ